MQLDSKEAVSYLLTLNRFPSYYSIAKYLRTEAGLKTQTGQVSSWHRGTVSMGSKNAVAFFELLGIEITDSHNSTGRPKV